MYSIAKQAREKMKAKAKSLAGERDQKVDSSDWSPAEPLNADAKTGMRPISKRAYKKGGKIVGVKAKPRADRKPRKSGGRVETEIGVGMANKNMKEANAKREGVKHVGGLKTGGSVPSKAEVGDDKARLGSMKITPVRGKAGHYKHGGKIKKAGGGGSWLEKLVGKPKTGSDMSGVGKSGTAKYSDEQKGALNRALRGDDSLPEPNEAAESAARTGDKRGGMVKHKAKRIGKNTGGALELGSESKPKGKKGSKVTDIKINILTGGAQRPNMAAGQLPGMGAPAPMPPGLPGAGAPPSAMPPMGGMPGAPMPGFKKGGRVGKFVGGPMIGNPSNELVMGGPPPSSAPGVFGGSSVGGAPPAMSQPSILPGGMSNMPTLATRPPVTVPQPAPMPKPPVAVPQPAPVANLPPPSSMIGTPSNQLTPSPSRMGMDPTQFQYGAQQPGGFGKGTTGGFPMGYGGFPGGFGKGTTGGFPGGFGGFGGYPMGFGNMYAPMGRKSGGRVTKVASSYKDMEAGAGSGEGRLQKTDIAKLHKDAPARKAGGRISKVAKSYKDMTAGAGSGEGRLQKEDIAKAKKARRA